MSKLLDSLKGKRVAIVYNSQVIVSQFEDSDDKFVQFSEELPKRAPKFDGEIVPASGRQITYMPLESISTIIDASSDEVYNLILRQIQAAAEYHKQQAQLKEAARRETAQAGLPPKMTMSTVTDDTEEDQ
jgi:hypothetical protein